MKFDHDCVRDIMLTVEGCDFNESLPLSKLCEKNRQYTEEQIAYCCLKMYEGNLLDITVVPILRSRLPGIKSINDLTYDGHNYLDNIRSSDTWIYIKKCIQNAGSVSLSVVVEFAKSYALKRLGI